MELAVPSLQALEREWAVTIRNDIDLLQQIAHVVQGPFHLIHPQSFAENLSAFQAVLKRHEVRGRVYFGKRQTRPEPGCARSQHFMARSMSPANQNSFMPSQME